MTVTTMTMHGPISVAVDRDRLAVRSPYSPAFTEAARTLGGKWTGEAWTFDPRDEPRVRAMMLEVYGTDGGLTEVITVHIDLRVYEGTDSNEVIFCGVNLASRPGRDQSVRLHHGATVIEGGFPSSGGSVKNPRLEYRGQPYTQDGARTVLQVRDVPARHPDVQAPGVTIVPEDEPAIDHVALLAERGALLARLAEIDATLLNG